MKRIKVIYINKRSYSRSFFDESDRFYYLYGIGHSLGWELLKVNQDIEVENWRADKTVSRDLFKHVDGIGCRIFKGIGTKFLGTFSLSMIRALRRECKKREYDILVHFHGLHDIGYDLISLLIPKIPVVVTHHGGGNFQFRYLKTNKVRSLLAEKFDRFIIKKRFDHLVIQTVTEFKYLETFLSSERVSRITPFGIHFELFKPLDKSESRRKLRIRNDSKVILSVGRADTLKGVQHVVKIYRELKKINKEVVLVCVDVQPGDLYYNIVKESGAMLLGHVSYFDLPVYYSASDVLVYIPFDDESLNFAGPGYVNAEALACGLPVVSSLLVHYWDDTISEVARVPRNTDEALNMTLEILGNPPDPVRCREISFRYFNWSYVMEHHLEIYNNLLRKYYNTSISGSVSAE